MSKNKIYRRYRTKWLLPLKKHENALNKALYNTFKAEIKYTADNYNHIANNGFSIVRKLDIQRKIKDQVSETVSNVIPLAGRIVTSEIERELKQDFLYIEYINAYLASNLFQESMESIVVTFYDDIAKVIKAGIAEEQTRDVIAKNIRNKMPAISKYRSKTIAITETHRAASYASERRAKDMRNDLGIVMLKDWIPVFDSRTRSTHRAMSSVDPIPLDDMFTVGGEKMSRPNDPRGSAANTIRCRCILRYMVGEGNDLLTKPSYTETPINEQEVSGVSKEKYKDWDDVPRAKIASRWDKEVNLTEIENERLANISPDDLLRSQFGDDYNNIIDEINSVESDRYRKFELRNVLNDQMLDIYYRLPLDAEETGRILAETSRRINLTKGVAEHYHLEFLEGKTGKFGKKILKETFEVYEKMNMNEVVLNANIDVGGYAWARYGFELDFDDEDSAKANKTFINKIKKKLSSLNIPQEVKKGVRKILDSNDPKMVWALSDLDYEVEGQKLGKKLLLNSDWHGKLKLKDEKAMNRFKGYVNGK